MTGDTMPGRSAPSPPWDKVGDVMSGTTAVEVSSAPRMISRTYRRSCTCEIDSPAESASNCGSHSAADARIDGKGVSMQSHAGPGKSSRVDRHPVDDVAWDSSSDGESEASGKWLDGNGVGLSITVESTGDWIMTVGGAAIASE